MFSAINNKLASIFNDVNFMTTKDPMHSLYSDLLHAATASPTSSEIFLKLEKCASELGFDYCAYISTPRSVYKATHLLGKKLPIRLV